MTWIRISSDSLARRRRGRRHRRRRSQIAGAAGAVARQAPLADRTLQDVAPGGAADPVLRVRHQRFLPLRRRAAGGGHAAPGRLLPARRTLSRAVRQEPADDACRPSNASPTCNSPRPTGCRSSTAGWCASISAPAPSCSRRPASPSPISTAMSFYDLTGSYGVNIFGNDFYKECIASAEARAHALGPVLGPYHPVIADNVKRLCAISGLDEVSFHMSGTEAVMQAVRLARYHTGRSHLVRFAGAYHGWWGDVQPGVGNPISPHETYTLADMSERTLHVLQTRRDIACVLVNPLQALHPNANAPADSVAGGQFAQRPFRPRSLQRMAESAAAGLHRAQHRPDLRRGVRRLPARRRRRPGIFRRARRHGDLRQEPGGRASGRRGLRPQGTDAPLPRRSPGRRLLRARHLQLASLRDGGDGRIPDPARRSRVPRGL